MRLKNIRLLIAPIVCLGAFACARPTPSSPAPQPAPTDEREKTPETNESPVPTTAPSSPKSWEFRYTHSSYPYTIITEAEIAQLPDTIQFRNIPALTQTVRIAVTDSGISVTDPLAPVSFKCDSAAALFSRAQLILPALPSLMTAGTSWKDSTTIEGCRGEIPVTSTVIRMFTVAGDTIYNQTPALLIKRTETIVAKGEGHEGQHRILLAATGSGNANLYLDVASGRFLGLTSTQRTHVSITTSGRVAQFLQRVREQIRLVSVP